MLTPEALFTQALGLSSPWQVTTVRFSPEARRIDFDVDVEQGTRFACPNCGAADAALHDQKRRTWRHLDFFQYEAYIHAPVSRVKCHTCDKVSQVPVPWARPGSRFTLLFEAFLVNMAAHLSVAELQRQVRVHDDRLWRILRHYVTAARAQESFAGVSRIGVDETAAKRAHAYISVFYDLAAERLLFAVPGRGKQTVAAFAEDLRAHGG